jgi:hypothetical protein
MKNLPTVMPQFPARLVTTKPTLPCTDPRFVYTTSAQTDIVKRFRAMGWVPPSEQKGAA